MIVGIVFIFELLDELKNTELNNHILKPAKTDEIKKFKDINELIHKLEHSEYNPLSFTDEEKILAATFFKTVNYYSFSIYRKLLHGKDQYYTFSECLSIYNFDCFLRENLMKFSGCIESLVKTSFVNHLCSEYRGVFEKADCYLDESNYINKDVFEDVINMLEKEINKSKSIYIIHHKQKKNLKIPIWVIMEELTFGGATYFIESFNKYIINEWLSYLVDRKEIDLNLKENYKSSIISWIDSTRFIRNTCAHHSRLYGVLLNASQPKYCSIDFRELKREGVKKDENLTLFARLLAIKNLLTLHRDDIQKEWNSFLEDVDKKIKGNDVIFENYLGLISNWKKYLII
ncbi:TPA: Abi family protein [Escherichia coli]|nr:Abi family protein [Staphylococcus arlettae]HAP2020608.1 Abi family protein [Escherichia coli]